MEFSVVVTTYGRPEKVGKCLAALSRLDFPLADYEVIIVDDGSPQPLDSVVAPYLNRGNVRHYRQTNQGASAGRNYGVKLARGKYIAFTDDDCEPLPDWLTRMSAALVRFPDAMIGGHTINRLEDDLCATASQELLNAVYHFYNADPEHSQFFATCNIAFPRHMFLRLGGLNPVFRYGGEDRDFCERWVSAKWQMVFVPEARVLHSHGMTLRSYWRQQLAYGRGAALLVRARETAGRAPIDKPGTFQKQLPVWLLKAMNTQRSIYRKVAVGALILLSQVAVTVGFFLETRKLARQGWPSIPSPIPLDSPTPR